MGDCASTESTGSRDLAALQGPGAPEQHPPEERDLARQAFGADHQIKGPTGKRPALEKIKRFFAVEVLDEGKSVRDGGLWKWFLLMVNEGSQVGARAQTVRDVHPLKEALLDLANRVNERATQAATVLGRLFLRTPDFAIHANLISSDVDEDPNRIEDVREISIDLHGHAQEVSTHIELRHTRAWRDHDGSAVEDLLSLCGNPLLPDFVCANLYATVLKSAGTWMALDEQRKESKGRPYALTANWPKRKKPHPRADAFNGLTRCMVEGHVTRASFHTLVLDLHDVQHAQYEGMQQGKNDDDEDKAITSAREKDEASEGAETEAKVQYKSHIKQELTNMDSNYSKMASRDSLLYLTPQVCAALLNIIEKGTDYIRKQLKIVDDDQASQFIRVRAARQLGNSARMGSHLAEKILMEQLTKHKHWLVQESAFRDVVSLLDQAEDSSYKLRSYLTLVVIKLCEESKDDSVLSIQYSCTEYLKNFLLNCSPNKQRILMENIQHSCVAFGARGAAVYEEFRQELHMSKRATDAVMAANMGLKEKHLRRMRDWMQKTHEVSSTTSSGLHLKTHVKECQKL